MSSQVPFERRPVLRRTLGTAPGIRWFIAAVVAVSLGCAVVARIFAADDFHTFGEALWWAAQTVTTVGYGDVIPATTEGRVIAFVLMLSGFATLSLMTASISAAFVHRVEAPRRAAELRTLLDALERLEQQARRARAPARLRRAAMKRVLTRWGPAALGVAIIVAVFGFALPRIASYRDVVEVVSALSGWEIAALLAAVAWNIFTFAPPWRAAMPGLGLRRALVVTQASTAAASVFPGGEAVGVGLTFGMLNAWGFRRAAIVAAVAVVSALNLLAKVLLPVAALAGLLVTGREGGLLPLLTLIAVAAVSIILGAGIGALRTDASTRAFGTRLDGWRRRIPLVRRRTGTGPLGERLSHFRSESIGLLRRRWLQLTVWTLLGHTAVFIVLLVTLRAVGVTGDEVSVVEAFAAWALTRLLTAIPITPGGLGIIELGLTGALVAAGGANDEVVAAVLLYRLLTWLPSILLGAPAALLWRRMHPAATT